MADSGKLEVDPESAAAKLIKQMEVLIGELREITDEISPILNELRQKVR